VFAPRKLGAMAVVEPSDDQISQVIEFAGLHPQNDRDLIRQALKVRAFETLSFGRRRISG
jgi:hypothetical protein